jgi:hypothetical protein
MLSKLRASVKEAAHRYSLFGKIEEVADARRHRFNAELKKAREGLKQLRGLIEDHGLTLSTRQRDDLQQELALAVHRVKRLTKKREFWRNRYVWAGQRHKHWGSVLKHRRDRVRRFILQHRTFQPYMANKKPWVKLTPEARYAIYLDFRHGLYVTSTYEGHPGDGVHATTSGHYIQNQPDGRARCWDAGSGRRGPMVAGQRREAGRCPSFLVEMFGPENDLAYKNGVRFTLAEGTELENMHDNHKHEWLRDGAPTK